MAQTRPNSDLAMKCQILLMPQPPIDNYTPEGEYETTKSVPVECVPFWASWMLSEETDETIIYFNVIMQQANIAPLLSVQDSFKKMYVDR